MNSIIVSSKKINIYLLGLITYEDVDVKVIATKGKISLFGKDFFCEVQNDFEADIQMRKLMRLKAIIDKIPEQPLTITFNDDLIEIKNIIL